MSYTYVFENNQVNIKTPGVAAFSDIKQEFITQEPTRIVRRSTYPNGFTVEIDQRADCVKITCNRELALNEDGSFTAPTA